MKGQYYVVQLSKEYEDCEKILNKLGAVVYKSQIIKGLIGYWSKLDIEYLRSRDFILMIEYSAEGELFEKI